jgi:hypothetical protein
MRLALRGEEQQVDEPSCWSHSFGPEGLHRGRRVGCGGNSRSLTVGGEARPSRPRNPVEHPGKANGRQRSEKDADGRCCSLGLLDARRTHPPHRSHRGPPTARVSRGRTDVREDAVPRTRRHRGSQLRLQEGQLHSQRAADRARAVGGVASCRRSGSWLFGFRSPGLGPGSPAAGRWAQSCSGRTRRTAPDLSRRR